MLASARETFLIKERDCEIIGRNKIERYSELKIYFNSILKEWEGKNFEIKLPSFKDS
jgi:hypothetical protein